MIAIDETSRAAGAMRGAPSRGARIAAGVVLASAGLLLIALGALWRHDRRGSWEVPRWSDGRFEPLEERTGVTAFTEDWVVPVQPDCERCPKELEAARARARARGGVRVTALLVDVLRPPSPARLAELDADRILWDRTGAWRRRWGHRVYGETMVFSPDGSLLRTEPPGRPAGSALGVPPDDF